MDEAIAIITTYLAASLRMATPLALAGIGEAISEKSGVLNIGLEAIMLIGAFCSFIVTFFTGSLALGLLAGIAGGMLVSLIHAYFSISYKADQTIVGLALNFTVLGLTSFLFLIVFGGAATLPSIPTFSAITIPLLSQIPIIGPVFFDQNIFVYIAIISIVIVSVVLYKTEWGIRLHAVGEHPQAADTVGINVFATRYLACMLNGAFGGIAGSYFTLARLGFFMENIIAGRGFIALVIVILGRRNPIGIFIAAMIIGFSEALQFNLQIMDFPVPSQVFIMFPYVVAVLVLLFSIGKSTNPSALAIPYERSKR